MASKEVYLNQFVADLRLKYGEIHITKERVELIWSQVKHIPDDLMKSCANDSIARHERFPGANKIIESCIETYRAFSRNNPPAQNVKGCIYCSNGARMVDGYAFQCTCPLGKLNYPALSLYTGQAEFRETLTVTDTEIIRETRHAIFRTCKLTGKHYFTHKTNPWRDHNPNQRTESLNRKDKEAYDSF